MQTPRSGVDFPNPWANCGNGLPRKTHYRDCNHICDKDGLSFYLVFNGNTIAVKDGVVLTECVTVKGCIQTLKHKGLLT